MTPDAAWMIGSVVTAVIATGPAYLAARRSRTNASHAVTNAVGDVISREFGAISAKLDEHGKQLTDIQEWQAEHTTEHAVSTIMRSRLELRRRQEGNGA